MIGIVVTGHGQFASGLVSSLHVIAGTFEQVTAVDFPLEASTDDLAAALTEAAATMSECQSVLFLSDVAGGSPFRCAVLAGKQYGKAEVVAGANLPMLLEVVMGRDAATLTELKTLALDAGKSGISAYLERVRPVKQAAAGI